MSLRVHTSKKHFCFGRKPKLADEKQIHVKKKGFQSRVIKACAISIHFQNMHLILIEFWTWLHCEINALSGNMT